MDTSTLSASIAAMVTAIALYSWHTSRRSVPLPPGPNGHWLFGSALDIAGAPTFYRKLAEYTEQYGPLASFRILHLNLIVISDPHLVTELFEKRATNYSDRDQTEMIKLTGWNTDIVMLQYGPTHKRYRTMLNRALNNRVAKDYIPLQQYEVRKFMARLAEDPEQFMSHARLLAASLAVRLAYGYKVKTFEDPIVKTAEEHMRGLADCTQPWNWAVNILTPLRHLPDSLPIAPFQRRIQEIRAIFVAHREKPFAYVQEQIAAGTAEDCFAAKLLQQEDGNPVDRETEEHVKRIASTFYAAGSDTTVSAVQSFFLAMTLYPETQAKAQKEITSYLRQQSSIGVARNVILPEDRPKLPYTSALVRELQRWHPVTPVVIHRSGNVDDNNVVSGGKTYRIPAGSTVIFNVWQVTHDPNVYERPETFAPERYLGAKPPPDPENYTFGFGRRICPGMHIAQQSMWISISNLLVNFTIAKAKDEHGKEITPKESYTNEIISHPLPFVCSIIPKDKRKEWLQEAVE